MSPMLTDANRAQADRRDPDGTITSLREARQMYFRQHDREHANKLVHAVYLRGAELKDLAMMQEALDLAREKGFAGAVVSTGPRLLLPMRELPAAIATSVRDVLKAHGLTLSEALLREIGNNTTQVLVALDEGEESNR